MRTEATGAGGPSILSKKVAVSVVQGVEQVCAGGWEGVAGVIVLQRFLCFFRPEEINSSQGVQLTVGNAPVTGHLVAVTCSPSSITTNAATTLPTMDGQNVSPASVLLNSPTWYSHKDHIFALSRHHTF
jgi:hypothetical protein